MKFKSLYIAIGSSLITAILLFLILSSLESVASKEMVITITLITAAEFIVVLALNEYLLVREVNIVLGKLKESATRTDEEADIKLSGQLTRDLINVLDEKDNTISELKKLAAFRKEFIADVSHELKTPIFAAQGFVHTLLDGAIKDKSVRDKFLKKAARSLDGLDALVQDMVTLSQMEIGELRMHREYFNMVELANEVVEQFENKADKKSVKLKVSSSSDKELLVYADPNRIFQVLSNLISNAINYTDEGGKVRIEILQDEEVVNVRVVDTGVGIPEEDLSKIFTRFYRVDKSRSRKQGGTGLGLAIVKHIVELHKSEIKVESEPGKGSTFSFLLPQEKSQKV